MDRVVQTLYRTLDAIESLGIEYMVMGGLVVPHYTMPVTTYDVDLTLALDESRLVELLDALEGEGISVPEPARGGRRNHLSGGMEVIKVTAYYPGQEIRIDLFPIATRYQEEAFTRRRRGKIDGREVWIIGPEDLILHKAIANRFKDQYAIERLVLFQGVSGLLDLPYLARWARELGVRAAIEGHFERWGLEFPKT
ncbi:MAG: nucleotidyltransferase [Planctomycetes bacterium]|nr:nucleotidyltransferase [Planctomycetota bacterium]